MEIDLFNKTVRLGVRYINFFKDVDVFGKLKVGIEFNGKSMVGSKNNLRTEVIEGNYTNAIHIANNASVASQGKNLNGSIIDIDIVNDSVSTLMGNLFELIQEAHIKEKIVFFNLLKEEFIETLKPEY